MIIEPTKEEVSIAMWKTASQYLEDKPAGTSVMVEGCLGLKKMSFWWGVRYRYWTLHFWLRDKMLRRSL